MDVFFVRFRFIGSGDPQVSLEWKGYGSVVKDCRCRRPAPDRGCSPQLPYFTPQPYGLVSFTVTLWPARIWSTAART